MKLVIVESPAKSKTISKYLGPGYKILASFGHVRGLPSKQGSVDPDNNFAVDYQISADSQKHIAAIIKEVKNADSLILATDPDREGEAIAWHVVESLKQKKKLPKNIKIERVVFNEITKSAVLNAIANPREVDVDLVNAQQARLSLDYLVGFTLSPILWRKLPGSRSAGRVQSVALRVICEREDEIERFISEEYWDIDLFVVTDQKKQFQARLNNFSGKKLEKFSITDKKSAHEIVEKLQSKQYAVGEIQEKIVKRRPYAPYITSSLQQDAVRRLGMTTKMTMMVAQKLYEGINVAGQTTGLITYMRTDGISLSSGAVSEIRK